MKWALAAALALVLAAPADAEVVSAAAHGFHLRHVVEVAAPPQAALAAFAQVAGWWDPEHTYSGDSVNLTLELRPGGCFCERFGGGGIEHMRVTYVDPGKRLVLTGGLGPLLYEATAAAMDIRVEGAGAGSKVTMNYKVAGFATGGADKLAPLVDKVLITQFTRFRTFAARKPR
jgi:hypothetical protein